MPSGLAGVPYSSLTLLVGVGLSLYFIFAEHRMRYQFVWCVLFWLPLWLLHLANPGTAEGVIERGVVNLALPMLAHICLQMGIRGLSNRFLWWMGSAPLEAGQRIILQGGYDPDPEWLKGLEQRKARIIKEVPGQGAAPALLVQFEESFEIEGVRAEYAILELRHVGARWRSGAACHVEACDFLPEEEAWKDRRQGKWVESHALIRPDG